MSSSLCVQVSFSGSVDTARLVLEGMKSAVVQEFESVATLIKPTAHPDRMSLSMLLQGVQSVESTLGDLMRQYPQAQFRQLYSDVVNPLAESQIQLWKLEF